VQPPRDSSVVFAAAAAAVLALAVPLLLKPTTLP
jgi:hypothetical protein